MYHQFVKFINNQFVKFINMRGHEIKLVLKSLKMKFTYKLLPIQILKILKIITLTKTNVLAHRREWAIFGFS
jgi:hypothetical protein